LPEPMTESVWFRGDSKFRSPMLQLHKGIPWWYWTKECFLVFSFFLLI
jgi:hypothetical protein